MLVASEAEPKQEDYFITKVLKKYSHFITIIIFIIIF